jgi:hypothetical protein
MTERECKQAAALKACTVDGPGAAAMEQWDRDFIAQMAHAATHDRRFWLTAGRRAQLRRLLVKYTEEMTAAGQRDLIFTETKQ